MDSVRFVEQNGRKRATCFRLRRWILIVKCRELSAVGLLSVLQQKAAARGFAREHATADRGHATNPSVGRAGASTSQRTHSLRSLQPALSSPARRSPAGRLFAKHTTFFNKKGIRSFRIDLFQFPSNLKPNKMDLDDPLRFIRSNLFFRTYECVLIGLLLSTSNFCCLLFGSRARTLRFLPLASQTRRPLRKHVGDRRG